MSYNKLVKYNNKLKSIIGGSADPVAANSKSRAIDALNIAAQHAPSSDLVNIRNLAHATRDEEVIQGPLSRFVISPSGKTPLMAAAFRGDAERVKTLLRSGLDPSQRDNLGRTAIDYARNEDIIFAFVESGVKNIGQCMGKTDLMAAAFRGDIDKIKRLLASGAKPNEVDSFFRSALHYSLNEDVVFALVEGGARVNTEDYTPLYYACKNNRERIVIGLIVCGADVNYNINRYRIRDEQNSALDIAVAKGHNNIVSILLAAGADVNNIKRDENVNNERSRDNLNPIDIVAKYGHVDVFLNLVSHGANINHRYMKLTHGPDARPNTPIFWAMENNNFDIVKLLIILGVDLTTLVYGNSILDLALDKGNFDIIKFILDYTEEINLEDLIIKITNYEHELKRQIYDYLISRGVPGELLP
jgi:ankyrin repeat protein